MSPIETSRVKSNGYNRKLKEVTIMSEKFYWGLLLLDTVIMAMLVIFETPTIAILGCCAGAACLIVAIVRLVMIVLDMFKR